MQSSRWRSSIEKITLSCGSSRCGISWCNKENSRHWMEKEKFSSMTDGHLDDVDARDFDTIWLCLVDDVLSILLGRKQH